MKSKKRLQVFAVILTVSMFFGSFSFAATPVEAVSAPAKVSILSAKATNYQTVEIRWRPQLGIAGYQVFRGKKHVATIANIYSAHYDTKLAPNTSYSYRVRSYKNAKVKQYYNSKKKKWQNKKPKKKYWKKCKKGKYKGKKTRTVKKTLYGAFSVVKTAKTPSRPAAGTWPSVGTAQTEALATIQAFLTENNKPEVVWDARIAKVAQRKAEYMASIGKVGPTFPALGGDAMDMMDREKIKFYNANEQYARGLSSFGQNMLNAFDATKGSGGNGVADWAWRSYERIGIGYCNGYISVITAY